MDERPYVKIIYFFQANHLQNSSYPSRPSAFINGNKSFQLATKNFNTDVKRAETVFMKSPLPETYKEARFSNTMSASESKTSSVHSMNSVIQELKESHIQVDSSKQDQQARTVNNDGITLDLKSEEFRPFSQLSITSDVVMIDDDEVVYHEPNEPFIRKAADLLTSNTGIPKNN